MLCKCGLLTRNFFFLTFFLINTRNVLVRFCFYSISVFHILGAFLIKIIIIPPAHVRYEV